MAFYVHPVCFTESRNASMIVISNCACPNYITIYECTVLGGGTTVWQGSALNCENTVNTILLLHSRFTSDDGTSSTCNNGDIVGQSLRFENGLYTSQLKVKVRPDLIGRTVECHYDNGTAVTTIGSAIIAG